MTTGRRFQTLKLDADLLRQNGDLYLSAPDDGKKRNKHNLLKGCTKGTNEEFMKGRKNSNENKCLYQKKI